MGFLIKLWNIISTIAVVAPKVWPVLKIAFTKLWNVFLNNRLTQKKKELDEAVKKAKETGDTSLLEAQIGVGEAVGDASVVQSALAVEPTPPLPATTIIDENLVEKKKSLDQESSLETTGSLKSSESNESSVLATVGKVAAAGVAIYIMDSLLSKKEAKASTFGFGSSSSSIIIDGSGTIKNYSVYRGGFRMGSRLLP